MRIATHLCEFINKKRRCTAKLQRAKEPIAVYLIMKKLIIILKNTKKTLNIAREFLLDYEQTHLIFITVALSYMISNIAFKLLKIVFSSFPTILKTALGSFALSTLDRAELVQWRYTLYHFISTSTTNYSRS